MQSVIMQGGVLICFIMGIFLRGSDSKKDTLMDLYRFHILDQTWEDGEKLCLYHNLNILKNAKNSTLWATWILDSIQLPSGLLYGSRFNLGNFDECMKPPWLHARLDVSTQYCIADVHLSDGEPESLVEDPYASADIYIQSYSKYKLKFNNFLWGVCMPKSCEKHSVKKIFMAIYKTSHLAIAVPAPRINVDSCQVAGDKVPKSIGYYIFIIIILASITTVCIGTVYSSCGKSEMKFSELATAVCLMSNTSKLKKQSAEEIKVLHGVRAIISLIVVGLHGGFVAAWFGMGNALDLDRETESILNIYQGVSVVDSFLVMSAFLMTKSFMAVGKINPIKVIIKRYLRFVFFIGPMMLFITFAASHVGSGPIYLKITNEESGACKKTWWISLLMLGNYIDTTNMCYPILWTVPVDFQLTVLAVSLFWIYQTKPQVAKTLYLVLTVTSVVLPGFHVFLNNSSPVPPLGLGGLSNYRQTLFASPLYLWTHLRAGPYFIGIGLGYLITIYKPSEYRNIISNKISLISLLVIYIITNLILVTGGMFHDPNRPYSLWQSVLFASLMRPIWALTFSAFLVICEYGNVPTLRNFLSWPPFTVMSKLSYGVYLVHTALFTRLAAALRAPLRQDPFESIIVIYGVTTVSFILSFALYLFYEAPLTNIINMVFKRSNKENEIYSKESDSSKKNSEKKIA